MPDVLFYTERLCDVATEYAHFVKEYWSNSPENAGEPPLDVDMELFCNLDRAGGTHLTVGRHNDEMVAAALYLVQRNPKHKTKLMALCDTFAVGRDWRGKGVGARMMRFVERALRDAKVDEMINGYREVYNTTPLFEKLGFHPYERYYRKLLTE